MRIISSQHFLDMGIVQNKINTISDAKFVEILCYDIGEIDGEEMAIMADGHHTMAAARDLGIDIRFVFCPDPEGLTGLAALDARWLDGDWYDVTASDPAIGKFDLIW